jgi:hypothetical protein
MTTLHHFRAPEEIGHQNPLADSGPCIVPSSASPIHVTGRRPNLEVVERARKSWLNACADFGQASHAAIGALDAAKTP